VPNKSLYELGSRIRSHRKRLGLSQEALAERAELDRSYIGGIERGNRNITIVTLCRVARALKIDVSDLTRGLPL